MNAQTRRVMAAKLFTKFNQMLYDPDNPPGLYIKEIDATLCEWGLEMASLVADHVDCSAQYIASKVRAANDQQKGA